MTHPNPSCRLSGRQLFGVLVVLGVAQLAVLSGCDTGSRSEGGSGGTPGVNPGDVCQTGAAFLLSASTSTGCVGQEIMLEGLNFSPDLGNNRVFFSDNDGEFSIEGLVTQFIDNGPHPIFGCPDTSIVVRVPGGVRSGFISLQVILPDGTKTDAGLVSYAGCPEILGFAVGTAGAPFLAVDAGFAFLNPDFQIYGYNLGTVTGIEIIDPSGAAFPGATVTQGGQATPAYTIAAGLDVVTVTLPTAVVVPTCSAYYLQIRLTDSSAGAPVSSNALIMPVREQFAPAEFEDLPGTIVGCLVPTGVRRGMVPIYYQVVMEPAQSRYDMVPEFLDPLTGTWIECEGPVQQGSRLMTGVSSQQGQYPAIVTGGASYVFEWDTVANGLVYDASDPQATPVTTRVRIRVENPAPAGSTCPTFSQPEARFESASLLIDNPVDFTAVPPVLVGSSGTIAESFNDNLQEDDTAGNTALWNDNESGVLTGLPVSVVPWGEGTNDVICAANSIASPGFAGSYQFNTNSGSITDISDPQNPVFLHDPLGGDPPGVTVIRSLVIEAGAVIEVFGPNPLRIQISGDGNPDTIVCQIAGTVSLDGGPGEDAAADSGGDGGSSGPGGGVGGAGGWVDISTAGGGLVNFDVPAERGGNFGGYPGRNSTYAKIGEASSAKAGPGGGAGGLTTGEAGSSGFSASFDKAEPGAGGPPRGDLGLINLVCGAGGGGGGGNVFRQTATANLRSDTGGGGGGGGGGLEIVCNGTVLISGTITANGGAGGAAETAHSGPGAGGSGGTVRISATGDIGIADSALISCVGGQGSETANQFGGDGAPGRVRLEASGTVNFPSQGDFSQVVPALPGISVSAGQAAQGAIDGGDGSDGPLDFSAFGGGLYVVDTDLGEIRGPVAVPSEDTQDAYLAVAAVAPLVKQRIDPVVWNLSSLNVIPGVTLRGVGEAPLILRVLGSCVIDGNGTDPTVDVSGFPGGVPDVVTDPTLPTPGVGGAGGPGAGDGGVGGYANSDIDFADGEDGSLSFLPAHMLAGSPFGGGGTGGAPLPGANATPAEGGVSVSTTGGGNAGAGGGGGHAIDGQGGVGALAGVGGSAFGSSYFNDPVIGGPFPYGGAGGAGGAGNVDADASEPFLHAPGSGAGGGGGFFQLAVAGTLTVTPAARVVARGGDAFFAPIGSGNGGGGAGGGVQIQCDGVALFEGAVDASGGLANQAPVAPAYIVNGVPTAGNGSAGRIRIETSLGFVDQTALQILPDPSIGIFNGTQSDMTIAHSLPYPVAVEGSVRLGDPPIFASGATVLLEPPIAAGTDYVVVYEGAPESLAVPGQAGEFEGQVSDPSELDNPAYIRTTWYIFTNRTSGQSSRVDNFELPFGF